MFCFLKICSYHYSQNLRQINLAISQNPNVLKSFFCIEFLKLYMMSLRLQYTKTKSAYRIYAFSLLSV